MKREIYRTTGEEETIALGRTFGVRWARPCVILLIGSMGAGKTTITKGIAAGAGAAPEDEVSSPTFPIIHEYGDPVAVYHIDLYRLDTVEEVEHIGLEEIMERPALIVLEWAERFPSILPERRVEIRIESDGGDGRTIEVTEYGD